MVVGTGIWSFFDIYIVVIVSRPLERYDQIVDHDVFTKSDRSVVVVVDDDTRVRESLGDLLCVAGFVVRLYRSGEEALQAGNLNSADCLVTDVRMQGMDGSELQRHVIATRPRLPIIFVTAHHDDAIRQQVLRRGAFAFLYKPCDGEELLAVIADAMKQ
jgi:FixJ family two-component response regulator